MYIDTLCGTPHNVVLILSPLFLSIRYPRVDSLRMGGRDPKYTSNLVRRHASVLLKGGTQCCKKKARAAQKPVAQAALARATGFPVWHGSSK